MQTINIKQLMMAAVIGFLLAGSFVVSAQEQDDRTPPKEPRVVRTRPKEENPPPRDPKNENRNDNERNRGRDGKKP